MPTEQSEAKVKTKARFEEVFKNYSALAAEKKKSRKKSVQLQDSILETLRNKLGLHKESESDETILNNTYNREEESPRFTKNKLKDRVSVAEKVNNDALYKDTENPAKGKKKKKKSAIEEQSFNEEKSYKSATQILEEQLEAVSIDQTKSQASTKSETRQQKSKKKKSKNELEHQHHVETVLKNDEGDDADSLIQAYQKQITENDAKVYKKGKRNWKEIEAKEPKDETATPDLDAEPQQQRPKYDDSLILGVYIHRTERLKTDLLVSHPTVKVHVVDETTGQYIRKEHSNRHVTSYYEQESVEHILPIMTQPYDFKKNKLTVPEWEEQIIFNERFGYFLQETEESPKVILFFEILDFVSMDKARINYETQNREGGWRRVAWAFLKLVGANGILNVDGKLRLQLYYPTSKVKKLSNSIEVFEWWNKLPWKYYPSTLYVTVKGLKLPENIALSVRSMLPVQQERGTISYSDLQTVMSQKISTSVADTQKAEILKWNKLPGQVCRIPNKFELSLRGGQIGCFCIIFSHNGRSLAAACANRDGYPIVVYEISSGQVLGEFNGHLSIVYSLCWSNDDNTLLSASSDGTVRVWDKESYHNPAKKVLPHPSFIYTAKYHPLAQYLVVTGGYDFVIRVWNINTKDAHGQLLQEFNGHKSFINTLCFDAEGQHMFSGDNLGLIIVWNTSVKEDTEENLLQQWSIDKEIKENELKGVSVNHLEVHPNGRRLLIHAKDSTLRVMDLRVLATKKYTGATNYHEQICSTFTPCGTFLFAGSEDGICYVWNSETGDQVAMYTELNYASPVRDVAFHPHENMVAFCAFGPSQPILIFLYDQKVAQQDVQTMKGICRLRTTATPGGPKIFGRHADVLNMSYSSFSSVVALYDYTAHRSDELTLQRYDIIQVLYKDNENWWFGRLANGQQGYFPANYVADASKLLASSSLLLVEERSPTPTKVHKLIKLSD
uniref:Jouberin n=1 Tax=Callorhinchus milii TaxID=7868 RepID=A0A4W3K5P9_CALMI